VTKIFLDITKLARSINSHAPTGILRTEFAYAEALFGGARDSEAVAIINLPGFSGAVTAEFATEILLRVKANWNLHSVADRDPVYRELKAELVSAPRLDAQAGSRFQRRLASRRGWRDYLRTGLALAAGPARLKRALARCDPGSAIHLNISHNQLEKPHGLAWARSAPAVRHVFFLHDCIPVDYPEYVTKAIAARHAKVLDAASRAAFLVLVNSRSTEVALRAYWQRKALRSPPIEVLPMGIAGAFLAARAVGTRSRVSPALDGHPYFVTLGTIEPRKNLLFLLSLWRDLIGRHGAQTPRLVIAGSRGWQNANIVDVLERSKTLAPFLIEVSGLSDAGMTQLMRCAAGVLQPSSVEGFGLPVIEALCAGAPVLAANSPAHREAGGERVLYLSPINGIEWVQAIESLIAPASALRARLLEARKNYAGCSWPNHVGKALSAIEALTGPKAS
jgi:glycosyltransferase involved in cell wall biosynthesis